jgi:predicted nucleic acid-binding protein
VSERTFLDTSVLLYAEDAREPAKRDRAQHLIRELVADQAAVVSTQVLQEFFVIATKKLKLPAAVAHDCVATYAQLDVALVSPALVLAAIELHRLHGLSFWDALIVRTAMDAGCTRLLSADLQHERAFEALVVENPFV